jgi:hypothetical protein
VRCFSVTEVFRSFFIELIQGFDGNGDFHFGRSKHMPDRLAHTTARLQGLLETVMKETDHAKYDELAEEIWRVLEEHEDIKRTGWNMDDNSIAGRTQKLRQDIDLLLEEEWRYRRSRTHSLADKNEHDRRKVRLVDIREQLRSLVEKANRHATHGSVWYSCEASTF